MACVRVERVRRNVLNIKDTISQSADQVPGAQDLRRFKTTEVSKRPWAESPTPARSRTLLVLDRMFRSRVLTGSLSSNTGFLSISFYYFLFGIWSEGFSGRGLNLRGWKVIECLGFSHGNVYVQKEFRHKNVKMTPMTFWFGWINKLNLLIILLFIYWINWEF